MLITKTAKLEDVANKGQRAVIVKVLSKLTAPITLEKLTEKIAVALTRLPPRRPTKPTKGSKIRRVDDKKARGRVKERRRRPTDD